MAEDGPWNEKGFQKRVIIKCENSYDGGKWTRLTYDDGKLDYCKNGVIQTLLIAVKELYHYCNLEESNISPENPLTIKVGIDNLGQSTPCGVYYRGIIIGKGSGFHNPRRRV